VLGSTLNDNCPETAKPPSKSDDAQAELGKFQDLIGSWRGVGQLQRGSTKGAWTEKCHWKWQFNKDSPPALELQVDDGQQIKSGKLSYQENSKTYGFQGNLASGPTVQFSGKVDDDRLTLVAQDVPSPDQLARITLRKAGGRDRLIILFERRVDLDRYQRIAEVGYTREGSNFGKGTNFIECVVTGGRGTIPVMHKGTTYYVCCSGCRDLFQDSPEHILAEYRARKDAEKNKQ